MRVRLGSWPWLAATLLTACTDKQSADAARLSGGDVAADAGSSFDNGAAGGNGASPDADAGLPPELEESLSFELPQAGATSVYIPNPVTDRVAIVNAETFRIETVQAGDAPTYVATVPASDLAIVLNAGSGDATLLRTRRGKTESISLPVAHDANAIAVAPDGEHAILYFDPRAQEQSAQSFQDVTVIDLAADPITAHGVSVGFRPRAVQFSRDGKRAFVLTEDGISIVPLDEVMSGPTIAKLVGVGDAFSDAELSTDVAVTPDGAYAVVRKPSASLLRLVELASGTLTTLDLSALQNGPSAPLAAGPLEITDLDLSPDGQFALAVARTHDAVVRIPIPGGFSDPAAAEVTIVAEQRTGSVTIAPNGKLALAYTTAAPVETVALLDLTGSAPVRGVRLRKAVRAVGFSQDGSRAFVLHATSEGPASAPSQGEELRIDRAQGYSLIDTQSGFAKLELTSAAIRARDLVMSQDATRLFALLRDDQNGVAAVQTADLRSFQVRTLELVAPPSSIGIVPGAAKVFIGQELAGGMITFLELETGELARAVTGFELTSRIRQ